MVRRCTVLNSGACLEIQTYDKYEMLRDVIDTTTFDIWVLKKWLVVVQLICLVLGFLTSQRFVFESRLNKTFSNPNSSRVRLWWKVSCLRGSGCSYRVKTRIRLPPTCHHTDFIVDIILIKSKKTILLYSTTDPFHSVCDKSSRIPDTFKCKSQKLQSGNDTRLTIMSNIIQSSR